MQEAMLFGLSIHLLVHILSITYMTHRWIVSLRAVRIKLLLSRILTKLRQGSWLTSKLIRSKSVGQNIRLTLHLALKIYFGCYIITMIFISNYLLVNHLFCFCSCLIFCRFLSLSLESPFHFSYLSFYRLSLLSEEEGPSSLLRFFRGP